MDEGSTDKASHGKPPEPDLPPRKGGARQFYRQRTEGREMSTEEEMKVIHKPEDAETEDSYVGSSLRHGTSDVSVLTIIMLVIAVLLLGLGWYGDYKGAFSAIQDAAIFAAAAVFAIFARIAQAGQHHREVMDALRDLNQQ